MRNILIPPGMSNTANVCYANSMLQCLFNQEVFVEDCHNYVSRTPQKGCKKCPICYPQHQRGMLTFNTLKLVFILVNKAKMNVSIFQVYLYLCRDCIENPMLCVSSKQHTRTV